jgi:Arc/MetJ family transcription regulator
MSRTVLDIDDEALAAAMDELGTSTKVETVNVALRQIAERRAARRRAALEVFDRMAADLEDFDRQEAWRGNA